VLRVGSCKRPIPVVDNSVVDITTIFVANWGLTEGPAPMITTFMDLSLRAYVVIGKQAKKSRQYHDECRRSGHDPWTSARANPCHLPSPLMSFSMCSHQSFVLINVPTRTRNTPRLQQVTPRPTTEPNWLRERLYMNRRICDPLNFSYDFRCTKYLRQTLLSAGHP
jgi:hypothetical protein